MLWMATTKVPAAGLWTYQIEVDQILTRKLDQRLYKQAGVFPVFSEDPDDVQKQCRNT